MSMKSPTACIGILLVSTLTLCAGDKDRQSKTPDSPPLAISKLEPKLKDQQVTLKFSVAELGGVAQLATPGKAPTFVVEATSEHQAKDLRVWIEGELADVLDRLQLSYTGTNPIKKGTIIIATGTLAYSPGAGERKGHEWYELNVSKWQDFRIVSP